MGEINQVNSNNRCSMAVMPGGFGTRESMVADPMGKKPGVDDTSKRTEQREGTLFFSTV